MIIGKLPDHIFLKFNFLYSCVSVKFKYTTFLMLGVHATCETVS